MVPKAGIRLSGPIPPETVPKAGFRPCTLVLLAEGPSKQVSTHTLADQETSQGSKNDWRVEEWEVTRSEGFTIACKGPELTSPRGDTVIVRVLSLVCATAVEM